MNVISLIVLEPDPAVSVGITQRRIVKFLEKGITVWLVDREDQMIVVFRPRQRLEVFNLDEEISGENVLPSGRFSVAEFFAMPGKV